jgi:probable F420-dependent oxidoreductase
MATIMTRAMMRGMRLGLHALGIGTGAEPAVIQAVAIAAEQSGFATLWSGEHVVMVDDSTSRYPYADDGKIAVPADADWIDPMIGLSFAAAATTTIGIATGVLLLPEHNPVIVAKQAASLDKLSGGRFSLGIGIGWSREEFDAIGVPFERRAARTADYVAAMRTIWRDDIASYAGEFANFENIRVNPKPRRRAIPILGGGNSDAALRRVAQWADGWYGFNLRDADDVAAKVTTLRRLCEEAGRDPAGLRVAVALRQPDPAEAGRLAQLGVDELVLVASPPENPAQAGDWVAELATDWQ